MGQILNIPEVETRQKRSDHVALLEDVRRGWHARLALAMERQIRMAAYLRQTEQVFAKGGLGVRTMCVDSTIYWEMVRRYGPECWRDKGFRKDMMRDEPALRVQSAPRKTALRVSGRRDLGGAVRGRQSGVSHGTGVRAQAASAGTRTAGGILLPS